MFDQINGLPVHALVLHAAVIFVPLLAVGAIVYALVARWRPKIGWAVALLAVIAPVSTLVAKLSGTELYNRLAGQGLKGKGLEILNEHMGFGTRTFWFSLALGVVSLVLVVLTWRRPESLPRVADLGLGVVMVALAVISGYYVYRTGDSGATAVWGTY
ncbi:DUF2231 domain-containing protein [Micromonosporaceae bacterium Da 78-11]